MCWMPIILPVTVSRTRYTEMSHLWLLPAGYYPFIALFVAFHFAVKSYSSLKTWHRYLSRFSWPNVLLPLCFFLGLCSYYGKDLPIFSWIHSPLFPFSENQLSLPTLDTKFQPGTWPHKCSLAFLAARYGDMFSG